MNRTLTTLFALASIFFLFGSLVVAEEGSANNTSLTTTAELTMAQKLAMKEKQAAELKEKMEMKKKQLLEKWHNEIERLKERQNAAADVDVQIADAADTDVSELREKIEEKIREHRGRQIEELEKKRSDHADRMEEQWNLRELEGNPKLIERLRLAIESANDAGLTTLAAELKVLYDKYLGKATLTAAEKAEIEAKLREFKKAHLSLTAGEVIKNAKALSAKFDSILKRLTAKLDDLDKTIPGSKKRLENVLKKLTKLKDRLDDRIEAAEESLAKFKETDENGNTNNLRANIYRLRAISKISVKALRHFVAMVIHYQNNGSAVNDVVLAAHADSVVEVAAADMIATADADAAFALEELTTPVDTADVAETNDSGADSTDDINDAPDDLDDSVNDDAEDDEDNSGGNNT